jgi:hypothetical protein
MIHDSNTSNMTEDKPVDYSAQKDNSGGRNYPPSRRLF